MKDMQTHTNGISDPLAIIQKVIDFLLLFIPNTLAKRVVAIILLAADVPVCRVVALSGVCDSTVRRLLKCLKGGEMDDLFTLRTGSGSRSKQRVLNLKYLRKLKRTTTILSDRLPI